jgi:hypothetical protein
MKNTLARISATLLALPLLSATGLAAQTGFSHIKLNGAGCIPSKTHWAISPDGEALSMIFDEFSVEVGKQAGKKKERKFCTIRAYVTPPPHHRVASLHADYRGFVSIPQGAKGIFTAYHGIANIIGGVLDGGLINHPFASPHEEDFTFSKDARVTSQCGSPIQFEITSTLELTTNAAKEQTYGSMDSVDATNGEAARYQVGYEPCSG